MKPFFSGNWVKALPWLSAKEHVLGLDSQRLLGSELVLCLPKVLPKGVIEVLQQRFYYPM